MSEQECLCSECKNKACRNYQKLRQALTVRDLPGQMKLFDLTLASTPREQQAESSSDNYPGSLQDAPVDNS